MQKRKIDLVILSDLHLGTYGCHAKELLQYLKSIEPNILVLNGDIIDAWQFSKSYFPREHFAVVKQIIQIISSGIPVYYITGNHDDVLRRFSDFALGNFFLKDKLLLNIQGKKVWIFHGDIFDSSITGARWLAKLGGQGYDLLIRLNRLINKLLVWMGRPRMSLSQKIKDGVKRAVKFVSDFEHIAAEIAISNHYDYVICGHVHQPQIRVITNKHGKVTYLNSGDWIENLSALEFDKGKWSIYRYNEVDFIDHADIAEEDLTGMDILSPFLHSDIFVELTLNH